ncbi:MAG: ATP synthase subunit I [Comamonas sp.]|nr:ATP synthase subunit I [Comamonas sp.]
MNYWIQDSELEDEEPQFKPLTAQEAQAWRQRYPQLSVGRLIGIQCVVALLVALGAWLIAGAAAGRSAGYGGLAILLPTLVFARALARKSGQAGAAMARLFGWELVKLVLCIAMLAAAPRLVSDLNWLALLIGLIAVMKTYWLALLAGRVNARKTN